MRPINIYTEPIVLTNIEECRINKSVNEHFQAVVTGYYKLEELDNTFLNSIFKAPFIIKATTDEQEEATLFRGMICDACIETKDELTKVTIKAKSMTAKLDMECHTRTYQGQNQTYREIVDSVLSQHENTAIIQPKGKGVLAKGLVVQYEETDWQFIKRMASQLHTVLVADCTNDHICMYFGNPEKKGDSSLDTSEYRIRSYMDLKMGEALEYLMVSREIKNLCERVYVNNIPYYVYQIKSSIKKQELVFQYTLRLPSGFDVPELFNEKVSGISIMGEVKNVKDTRVQVKLFSETDYSFGNRIWFPFATVYSSPDGTGWYCMPEKGDQVRLYVPDQKEETACIISAVHLENEEDLRTNTDEKSIRTKYQKEIRFTPDKIIITNHKGTSITLDDSKGISIKSKNNINIISGSEIEIKGGQIGMEGQMGVYLMEGPNMLMVRDGIKEQGMNIERR